MASQYYSEFHIKDTGILFLQCYNFVPDGTVEVDGVLSLTSPHII